MAQDLQAPGSSDPKPASAAPRRSFPARVFGAARLDASVFEEVEHDVVAIWQAAVVVGLAGLARGFAAVSAGEPVGLIGSVFIAYICWGIVCLLIWLVGVVFDHDTSTLFELLRTIGFAAAPILLLIVGAIPVVAQTPAVHVVAYATHAAAVAALVVAARQALDISTLRAAVICGIVAAVLAVVTAYVLHGIAVRLEGMIDLVVSAAVDD
jgi:hypothetical protein